MSSAFDISSQETDINMLVFHATSLEAAEKLMLSTEPRRVRDLATAEVSAICGYLDSMYNKAQITMPVTEAAVCKAIYFGRVRESRDTRKPFTEEPCLYLVFPHLEDDHDVWVAKLLRFVVEPSFKQALLSYDLPQVPGGVKRAAPPKASDGKDKMRGVRKHYEVRAHSNEDWNSTVIVPWSDSIAEARRQIHHLAWKRMQEIVQSSVDDDIRMFRDMLLLIVIPRIEHTVATDCNVHIRGGGSSVTALKEAASFYDDDLNPEFLSGGRALYSGGYNLTIHEEATVSAPLARKPSIKQFFT